MHRPSHNKFGLPHLGFGVGLRSPHYGHILREHPEVDWFEIISENYIDMQGWPRHVLDQVAERYPIVMHGVSMSIGSTDPLNVAYLKKLKKLASEVNAVWVSDHLCWTGVLGHNAHDLLPVALNEESLNHVIARIKTVQDILERPLILENPSSYVQFHADTLTEWEFLKLMSEEADCGLLLDVNNVYVSSFNHGFDPMEYLQNIPAERVVQFHLAGHTNCGTHIVDTHDNHVVDEVWKLYYEACQLTGGTSTLLEWDANIPPFEAMHAEVLKAKTYLQAPPQIDPSVTQQVTPNAVPHPLHLQTNMVE